MSKQHDAAHAGKQIDAFAPPNICAHARTSPRRAKRAWLWSAFLPFIIVSSILANWAFLAQTAFAATLPTERTSGMMTFQQVLKESQQLAARQTPFQRPSNQPGALKPTNTTKSNKPLPSAEPATMKDMAYTLDDSFVLHRPTMAHTLLAPKVAGAVIPVGVLTKKHKSLDSLLPFPPPRT